MVVVAAGRDEVGAGPAGGQRKTQYAAMEIQGAVEIGDPQMDVPDPYPGVDGGQPQGHFPDLDRLAHGAVLGGNARLAGLAFDTHM
jgi:hypothetical protein